MKKLLITGGSGFVGKNLCEGLQDEYEIFAPRHAQLDLCDFFATAEYIKNNRIDIVIHAAVHVPMINGQQREFYNDMQMFLNLEKLSSELLKVLYFGSGAEYDKRFDVRMVTEQDIGNNIPVSEYGLAKYTMNMITERSDNIYNLRLFGVFGRYEAWQIKFLSNLCCKAVYDLPLTVRKDCFFDFLYIDDLVNITRWFIENHPKHNDYNVCMGKEYRLLQLAEMVKSVSRKELPITLLCNEKNLDYSASGERLWSEVNNINITPMYDGLTKLYKYYEKNRHMIDYDILKRSR